MDDKTVQVVLDGINNILTTAKQLNETDKVAIMVKKCDGLDRIEQLQSHEERGNLPQIVRKQGPIKIKIKATSFSDMF